MDDPKDDPKTVEFMTEQRDRLKAEVDAINPKLDAANLENNRLREELHVTKQSLEQAVKDLGQQRQIVDSMKRILAVG